MDFIEKICELSNSIPAKLESINTEEATKNALVLPFLAVLGYNVFEPTEVIPEFIADFGPMKREKIDYLIKIDKRPMILIECKQVGCDLDQVSLKQLFSYFGNGEAPFAILTNGIIYRFYSDLEKPNKMDLKPFFEFDMLDIKEPLVMELKNFEKSSFDLDKLKIGAPKLKYLREINTFLRKQMTDPDEDFVKFLTRKVYDGAFVESVKKQFTQITIGVFDQFVEDRINERLIAAKKPPQKPVRKDTDVVVEPVITKPPEDNTTKEELEGYYIVKTILREAVDPERIFIRNKQNYIGILLDNSNHNPICRLYFKNPQKYIALIDEEKREERINIDKLDDIYLYADRFEKTAGYYESHKDRKLSGKSITAFSFKGTKHEVSTWKDFLLQMCNILAIAHKDQFEEILSLNGRKRPYFARDPSELKVHAKIDGTNIYVETNLSADRIGKISSDMISLFGYSEGDLSIVTQ